MAEPSPRLTLFYSCAGHLFIHLCTAFYFVIVLALEAEWQIPYPELIELWTLGSLLVGAVALPAGMLSDRIGAPVMMAVFFCGLGACSVGAGLSTSTTSLWLWLAGIGLFASIYHPVGIPWLVRNAGKTGQGKALGFNGIFGSLGAAVGGIVAGTLTDLINWRAAFILPGFAGIAIGLLLLGSILEGRVQDSPAEEHAEAVSKTDRVRIFMVLLVTMFSGGLIFNSTQTSLPKALAERLQGVGDEGVFGIGLLVAMVYGMAALMQVIGGHLADRFPLKLVYAGAFLVQMPLLWIAAGLGGKAFVLLAVLMVVANVGALPAENMMLARYSPSGRHGLVFGLKFVVAFGAAPVAVQLVAHITKATGEFYWVFAALAGVAALAFTATLAIPGNSSRLGAFTTKSLRR